MHQVLGFRSVDFDLKTTLVSHLYTLTTVKSVNGSEASTMKLAS
jgi:hypothetical protein